MDLVLLAALPGTSPAAITESLKLLSRVLQLAEKSPTDPHLVSLGNQISAIATLPDSQVCVCARVRVCVRACVRAFT